MVKKPDLQTIVSVAEILSALAVVASLIYVAGEFRRSQTLTSTDVQTLLYDRMQQMDSLVVANADFAAVLDTARRDGEALSPVERIRFLAYEHIFYDSWEIAWTAYRDGVLDEGGWEDWDGWFGAEAGRRPRLGWIGNRHNHGDDFARYVDRRLAAGPEG